jgi:methylmalonyl-CoA mutase cobalamin-binding subunit
MSAKFVEDLVTALASAGLGVNIIVVCPEEQKEEEKDDKDIFDAHDPYAIFGSGTGGGSSMDGILQGPNTP